MHRIVITAFKAIAMSIIFVVVWSVAFYLYRAYSLNEKMESIMVTMEQEVAKNNYLSEPAYNMYEGMLRTIASDMNNGSEFVQGFRINYDRECYLTPPENGLTYCKQLNTPADYGDIQIIELSVVVNAVDLFYDPAEEAGANTLQIREGEEGIPIEFTYVSQVPCLRYISVTD